MNKLILAILFSAAGYSSNAQYCLSGGPSSNADSNLEALSLTGESGSINFVGCPGIIGVQEYFTESATLNAGSAYVLTVQFGTCGGNYAGVADVWIDYNSNGIFEASESILNWSGTPPMVAGNYVFSVPASSLNGLTRMRVMHAEGQAAPLDPCANFTWGSVTDFNIIIQNGVDCSAYTGDDINDPRVVASIPFMESYNSSFCYSNQNPAYNSPDVFYKIDVSALAAVKVSLCGSTFDTFLSIQDQSGNIIAINDDAPSCGTSSEINVLTTGYDSLYVVVEGWGTEMGDYTINIGEGSVGINELSIDPYSVYPNPTRNAFKLNGNYIGAVSVLNMEGQVVLSKTVTNNEEVDVSSLSSGFYIVRLKDDNQFYDKKLIIE